MARSAVLLGLACLTVLCGASSPARGGERGGERVRVARAATAARWLRLIADVADSAPPASRDDDADAGDWFPRPIPLNLPLGVDARGRPASVPLLLLPVPVPPAPTAPPAALPAAAPQSGLVQNQYPTEGSSEAVPPPPPPHSQPPRTEPPRTEPPRAEPPSPPELDYIISSQQLVELFQAQTGTDPELPPVVLSAAPTPPAPPAQPDEVEESLEPVAAAPSRGARLVRMRRYQLPGPSEAPPPYWSVGAGGAGGAPPPPRFPRSLLLRGVLTVPRASYSEPYTVWWDADSGASRVDLHGGAASAYRTMTPDGRTLGAELRLDRSGAGEVRRCVTAAPRPTAPEDRANPALPDLHAFAYAGSVQSEFGRVERWAHTVRGGPGELGAAPGESLAFRHELLLTRAADNLTTTPLKYSVSVDSSVLGAASDGYVHRYTELQDRRHDPGLFVLDLVESCEEVTQTEARERVEPLREFTLSHRDPRYDLAFDRYKVDYRRRYMDNAEEAVRKNLLMQGIRFVNSGNRQGATFRLKVNYLGDRLDAETRTLSGVAPDAVAAARRGEKFPHKRAEIEQSRGRLPRAFDWRARGAVTHVRSQTGFYLPNEPKGCQSCWAFSVVGSVEGALFVQTGRLVPLSEQSLVDCAHPFGTNGCERSWPSAAFAYVRERGLPALNEYTPYQAEKQTCRAPPVPPVTRISAHVNVLANYTQALKLAIRRHAPTVVIIGVSKALFFYHDGIFQDERCPKGDPVHAVLAVGWDPNGGEHFVVKNSWGAAWGESGYVRLGAHENECGVLQRPSYPRLEIGDVARLPASAGAP